jgi:hypothetical protein
MHAVPPSEIPIDGQRLCAEQEGGVSVTTHDSCRARAAPATLGRSRRALQQELVGGFFEMVFDDAAEIHLFVNDDADDLPVNGRFGFHEVRGTAVFSRSDDEGRTAGLSDEDIVLIRALYG